MILIRNRCTYIQFVVSMYTWHGHSGWTEGFYLCFLYTVFGNSWTSYKWWLEWLVVMNMSFLISEILRRLAVGHAVWACVHRTLLWWNVLDICSFWTIIIQKWSVKWNLRSRYTIRNYILCYSSRLRKNDEVVPDKELLYWWLLGEQKFLFHMCLHKYLLQYMLIIKLPINPQYSSPLVSHV